VAAAQHGRARPPRHGHRDRAVRDSVSLARARNTGEVIEGLGAADARSPPTLAAGRIARRDRAPSRTNRPPCASCAASSRPGGALLVTVPPTSGCGRARTRSTTTIAATRAAHFVRVRRASRLELVRTTTQLAPAPRRDRAPRPSTGQLLLVIDGGDDREGASRCGMLPGDMTAYPKLIK